MTLVINAFESAWARLEKITEAGKTEKHNEKINDENEKSVVGADVVTSPIFFSDPCSL